MKPMAISATELRRQFAEDNPPIIINVRRRPAFLDADRIRSRKEGGSTHVESASVSLRLLVFLVLAMAIPFTHAAGEAALELEATIPMPAVKGRIDHLTIDLKRHRLFVAALGNDTVEVLDVERNRHEKSLPGFGEPQGVLYLPESNRLYVTNGSSGRVDILDAESLVPIKRIEKLDDADNVRYDFAQRKVVVGYGKGALQMLDADSGDSAGDIRLSGHPESFQLEASGPRIFANVPDARHVAVVDRAKREVTATWEVPGARANFPMALDEAGRRLFVGTRSPALMLVYDIDSGKVVAKAPIGGDTDDIFFEAARKRVYLICGEGRVDVFDRDNADQYVQQGSIKTRPRARTGLFVPDEGRLYVAAPAAGKAPARILVYRAR
jgi:DNA-binding beta-propeller fold protein YncE